MCNRMEKGASIDSAVSCCSQQERGSLCLLGEYHSILKNVQIQGHTGTAERRQTLYLKPVCI